MRKAVFTNKIFYILLISFIIVLLVYNSIVSIKTGNIYGLISIFIEFVLLILIFTKNQYAKLMVIVWAILSFIVAYGFELIANLMDDFSSDFKNFKINLLIYNIIWLAIGVLIIDYTRRTVILAFPDTAQGQTGTESNS